MDASGRKWGFPVALVGGLALGLATSCTPCASTKPYQGTYASTDRITFKSGRSIPENHLIIAENGEVASSVMPVLKPRNYTVVGSICPDRSDRTSVGLITSSNVPLWMGRSLTFQPDLKKFTLSKSIVLNDSPLAKQSTYIRVDADR